MATITTRRASPHTQTPAAPITSANAFGGAVASARFSGEFEIHPRGEDSQPKCLDMT
jgi:hypothetical protein